jgi:glycosyltransferase involved in cell wall biosynthesis
MNILLSTLAPPHAQPTNAVPLVGYGLLTELAARHNVTLVTVASSDSVEAEALAHWRALGVKVHVIHRSEPRGRQRWQRRWRLASAWLAGRWPWRTVWFWEPAIQSFLDQLFSQQVFDLVLVDDNAMGVYHYRIQAPTIFVEHEVRRPRSIHWQGARSESLVRWALREIDWRRWPRYQRTVWQRFDRIQLFTHRDAEALRTIAPTLANRARVNPFGLLMPPAADLEHEEEGLLVFAGGFSHPPNVDAALWLGNEMMPLLRQRCPGVRLMLVGSFPPESVRRLACADMTVTGRVPMIEPYLERASVLLAPLRIGGGMRMKVLQGMALGKAVVTTGRGAEGLLLPPAEAPLMVAETTETLVDAVAHLLNNRTARHDLGERARRFVNEHHSAAAYVNRLEAIGRELQISTA